MSKNKILRARFDEKTSKNLKFMIDSLKSRGSYVKISSSSLSGWIVDNFKENFFEKKKELLYYQFSDHQAYAKKLLTSGVSLDEIEQRLREFRRKKTEFSRKKRKALNIKGSQDKLHTLASVERKIGFE